MREGPRASMLAGSIGWRPQLSSWKGTELLAEDIPLADATLTADVTQSVPERLTFTVPQLAPEFRGQNPRRWVPEGPNDPLSEAGVFVELDIHIWSSVTAGGLDAEPTSTTRVGRFYIQNWEHNEVEGTVEVEAVGVLQRVADAKFRSPQVPRPSSTLASELRRLMLPGVPVQVDPDLVDRACPKSFTWDEDRLGALYDLADAWPARLRVDQFGTARMMPVVPDGQTPLITWVQGSRGTLIGAPRMGTRDGVANVVVARSAATDQPGSLPLQAVSAATGAMSPAVYGEKTTFWSSPLATTTARLQASADAILRRKTRPAIVRRVTCVPDPRVELDDPVQVVDQDGPENGVVVGYSLPLLVGGGQMTVDVGVG